MTAGTFATQPQPPQSPTSTDGLDRAHSGNTRLSRPNTFTSNPAAGYEGDEDSSDEDEDTNRENERKKLLEDLTNDPYDYKAEEDQTYDVFKKSYQGAVEHCVLDEKDANQRTIIHYVVHKQNDKVFKEVRWRFLIRLSLEIGGSILSERSSRDRTCLHLAVDSSFIELTKCICNYARKDALSEAIKIRTLDGQTCLHMAITAPNGPFLDLVRAFMNKTHHNALEQQRKPLSNSDGEGAGNTPLHDLVSIERCKLPTRICTKPPGQCEKCKKNPPEDTAQREEKSYIKTLNQLIEKCPAAMSTLNEAQESPYQYHLSTRSKYMPSWKKLEFPQVTEDNDPSLSDNITSREKTERRLNVPVTPASLADSERRQKRPKDSRDEKSQEFTASKSGKHSRAVKQYSQSLTAKVGQILMHESLSQKDFEKACVSLFGKKLPSSSLTFKAVGPLSDKMLDAHSDLMLEPILAYVELNLKNETSSMSMNAPVDKNQKSVERLKITARRDHMNSVLGFFEWLRDIKGVKRIVKLVVSDDQDLPCSDEVIEQCLHGFDIRYLDWNRDDICSMSLKAEAPFLREVWLSWSGRNSSLLGWSNPDCGLRKLGLLLKAHVILQKGHEGAKRNELNIRNLRDRLNPPGDTRKIDIPDYEDYRAVSQGDSMHLGKLKEENFWLDAIDAFAHAAIKKVDRQTRTNMNPIKVAVIDDGVSVGELSSGKSYVGGWYADKATPDHRSMNTFYFSEKGHGTEMAKLIQRVCPFATFFIGKLDTRNAIYKSVAESAVAAIREAINHGVHIISMSWTMYETKRENEKDLETLNTVIEDAGRKGIIMYCAGEDQGQNESNSKQPYPASSDSKRIKRIGSTDQYGNPSKFVNTNFVDYLFPGEIPVRASDITVAEDQVGSSAATALAAGLAAMILWCTEAHRVIEKKEKSTNELDFQKEGRMNVLFDALKTSNNFVNITNEINDAKDQEDCVGYLVQSCRRKVPAMIK